MSKEKNQFNIVVGVSLVTKLMIAGGLALIVISKIPMGNYDTLGWVSVLKQIIDAVGATLFSAGVVSVLVEISTISGVVDKAFKRLLNAELPIESFSDENVEKIYHSIMTKRIGIPYKQARKGIYRYEENLRNLIKSVYYEYHKLTYYVTPDAQNNCFHIKTKVSFRLINKHEDDANNTLHLGMKLYKTSADMSDEECRANWEFQNFLINDKEEDAKDYIKSHPVKHRTESKYYDYKLTLEKPFGSSKKNEVIAEYTYDVPMFDTTQSFKIVRSCKNIEHKFYIYDDCSNGDKWAIKACAFSSFYHKQSMDESNFLVDQDTDQHIVITFKDWAVVGCGYVVSYQKVT